MVRGGQSPGLKGDAKSEGMEKIQKISFRRLWNGVISLVRSLEIDSIRIGWSLRWRMNFGILEFREIPMQLFLLLFFFLLSELCRVIRLKINLFVEQVNNFFDR